jgi:hypothetical protein
MTSKALAVGLQFSAEKHVDLCELYILSSILGPVTDMIPIATPARSTGSAFADAKFAGLQILCGREAAPPKRRQGGLEPDAGCL